MSLPLAVTLRYTRSTKNTHRFDEPEQRVAEGRHVIGQLYVQKSQMPTPPEAIRVEITTIHPGDVT